MNPVSGNCCSERMMFTDKSLHRSSCIFFSICFNLGQFQFKHQQDQKLLRGWRVSHKDFYYGHKEIEKENFSVSPSDMKGCALF